MTATVTHEPMALPGGAPRPPVSRPRVLLVGTGLVSAATAMLFAGMLGLYLSIRSGVITGGGTWVPDGTIIPLVQPNMDLFTLLMSVVTMQWAVSAIKNDDRANTYLALSVTLLLGFAFIVESGYLYSLMQLDIASQQGSLIYAITGTHLAVLLGAMVFTVLMGFRALAGQFTSRQHDGITAAAIYWYVMVAIYAVIWLAIFVTK